MTGKVVTSNRRLALNLTLLLTALVLSIASLCRLWEQDVYWQIRMGEDFLKTWNVFRIDNWSFTATNFHDVNYWWIPSIILYWVQILSGAKGLVIFRGVLVFSYLSICGLILKNHLSAKIPQKALLFFTLVLIFASGSFRFQLRPDFMVGVMMALLVWLWTCLATTDRNKIALSFPLCILAANLHCGPPALVILAAIFYLWGTSETVWRKILYSGALGLTFFVTPTTFYALPMLLGTFRYGDIGDNVKNYDWDSFNLSVFQVGSWGLTGFAWLLLCGLSVAGVTRKLNRYVLGLTTFLLVLSFYRFRGVTFFTPVALPLVCEAYRRFFSEDLRKRAILISSLGFLIFICHVIFTPHPWGIGVDEWVYPVEGVEFLKSLAPKPNIMNDASLGNYMIWNLQDYKVMVDTRQYPFEQLGHELAKAGKSPIEMKEMLDRYDINVIFLPIPNTGLVPGHGLQDGLRGFFPNDQWALVFFDNHYMILLRRIPEHEKSIAEHELKSLTPQFPPHFQSHKGFESPNDLKMYLDELDRCDRFYPKNLYCAFARLFVYENSDKAKVPLAVEKIHELEGSVPQFKSYVHSQWQIADFFGLSEERKVLSEFY